MPTKAADNLWKGLPATVWFSGLELRSLGLAVVTLIHRALRQRPLLGTLKAHGSQRAAPCKLCFHSARGGLSPFSRGFDPRVITAVSVTFPLSGVSPRVLLLLLWCEGISAGVQPSWMGACLTEGLVCPAGQLSLRSPPPDHPELCRVFHLSWDWGDKLDAGSLHWE